MTGGLLSTLALVLAIAGLYLAWTGQGIGVALSIAAFVCAIAGVVCAYQDR